MTMTTSMPSRTQAAAFRTARRTNVNAAWHRLAPGLIALALALVLFSRVATAVGGPKAMDFLHFSVVPVLISGLLFGRTSVTKETAYGLSLVGALLCSVSLSAAWGGAAIGNVLLALLILGEPYVILAALVSRRWSRRELLGLQVVLAGSFGAHVLISSFEWLVLGQQHDDVQGLFQDMGAGHHVGGAFALSVAVYYLHLSSPAVTTKLAIGTAALGCIYASDSKQVLAVFGVAYGALWLAAVRGIRARAKYLVVAVGAGMLVWMIPEEIYRPYLVWLEPTLLIEGFSQKLSVFALVADDARSVGDHVLGHGSGHTVGKLASMIPKYRDIFPSFLLSDSSVTDRVFAAEQAHFATNSVTGSSIFSMRYLWPMLYGDLGAVGVVVYVSLLRYAYQLTPLPLSRYLVICVVGFGSTFTWVEEPQYMVVTAVLLGLIWQSGQDRRGPSLIATGPS